MLSRAKILVSLGIDALAGLGAPAILATLLMVYQYRNATCCSTIPKGYSTYVFQQLRGISVLFLEQKRFI